MPFDFVEEFAAADFVRTAENCTRGIAAPLLAGALFVSYGLSLHGGFAGKEPPS
jgi:hypothetical protein